MLDWKSKLNLKSDCLDLSSGLCRNLRTKYSKNLKRDSLFNNQKVISKVYTNNKNRQASTEDCRFLLVTYSLFTLHYNLVADFWEVIGNSE